MIVILGEEEENHFERYVFVLFHSFANGTMKREKNDNSKAEQIV